MPDPAEGVAAARPPEDSGHPPAPPALRVSHDEAGRRLDRFLVTRLPEVSRSRLQALIQSGAVLVNRRAVRPSARVAAGDEVAVSLPPPAPLRAEPEPIPLKVVYEDADVVVLDKPAGLVVHPAPGHPGGTLVNALLARYPALESEDAHSGEGDRAGETRDTHALPRPGIVHRLDKDTSGLLVVAKHERARQLLAAQLKARTMDKRYLALVEGTPRTASGTVDAPIARSPRHPQQMAVVPGGREAITHFRLLRQFARHSLLECKLVTGRTHQIRVHLAAIGHPVAGDTTYGRKAPTLPLSRQFLHAARLAFVLPSGEARTFAAPLPPDLQVVLDGLDQAIRASSAPTS